MATPKRGCNWWRYNLPLNLFV